MDIGLMHVTTPNSAADPAQGGQGAREELGLSNRYWGPARP